jgi:hypothetical protein
MPLKWNMSITKLQHNLIDIHVYEEKNSCKHEGLWILVRNSSPLLTYITVLLELKKQNHGSSSLYSVLTRVTLFSRDVEFVRKQSCPC